MWVTRSALWFQRANPVPAATLVAAALSCSAADLALALRRPAPYLCQEHTLCNWSNTNLQACLVTSHHSITLEVEPPWSEALGYWSHGSVAGAAEVSVTVCNRPGEGTGA